MRDGLGANQKQPAQALLLIDCQCFARLRPICAVLKSFGPVEHAVRTLRSAHLALDLLTLEIDCSSSGDDEFQLFAETLHPRTIAGMSQDTLIRFGRKWSQLRD